MDRKNKKYLPPEIEKYERYYSDSKFWCKILKIGKKAGLKVVYAALLLYYLMLDGSVALKDKLWITGALGYFILPLDVVPDFLFLPLGFSDDLTVLLLALNKVRSSITPEVERRAKETLRQFFHWVDEARLSELDVLIRD